MTDDLQPTVRLRAMEPEDLDLLYRMENDRMLWGVGNTNVPYSRYALHDYIANASSDIYADGQVRFMVERADGETVGIADIVNFNPTHRRAEVGIVIKRSFRRQGLARATMRLLMDYALTVLHLRQLYAIASEENVASLALFSSMGFERKLLLEDWLYDGRKYHNAVLMQLFL